MACKAIETTVREILVSDMRCGEIGEVTKWTAGGTVIMGSVVQRVNDSLIVLAEDRSFGRPGLHDPKNYPDCRVRILPRGTRIEIGEYRLIEVE